MEKTKSMTKILYEWKRIESIKDLPEKEGKYDVRFKSGDMANIIFNLHREDVSKFWVQNIVEYLSPVEPLSNWQDILKVMLDTHEQYAPNIPITHEESELLMYMAKRISKVAPLNVEDEVIRLINDYWRFDDNQRPISSWHEKQDLINAVKTHNNG